MIIDIVKKYFDVIVIGLLTLIFVSVNWSIYNLSCNMNYNFTRVLMMSEINKTCIEGKIDAMERDRQDDDVSLIVRALEGQMSSVNELAKAVRDMSEHVVKKPQVQEFYVVRPEDVKLKSYQNFVKTMEVKEDGNVGKTVPVITDKEINDFDSLVIDFIPATNRKELDIKSVKARVASILREYSISSSDDFETMAKEDKDNFFKTYNDFTKKVEHGCYDQRRWYYLWLF